ASHLRPVESPGAAAIARPTRLEIRLPAIHCREAARWLVGFPRRAAAWYGGPDHRAATACDRRGLRDATAWRDRETARRGRGGRRSPPTPRAERGTAPPGYHNER